MKLQSLTELPYPVLITSVIAAVLILWASLKLLLPKPKISGFHEKFVLITGCDTGFGKDVAIRLDAMGFNVIGACLTLDGKKSLEEVCSKRSVGLMLDVTKHEQVVSAFEEVKRILPPGRGLWALDNNAGYMTLGPAEWFPIEEYRRMADVNLWGLVDVTKTFLPLLKIARGRVINIASMVGLFAGPFTAPYAITKYGVEAFSDALRREMEPWGIKVSVLEPQGFKTPLWDEITKRKLKALWDGLSPELKEDYGEQYRDDGVDIIDEFFNKETSPHTHMVIDTVIDAITSRDPQKRYQVGLGAKITAVLASLPTSWADAFLKLKSKPLLPKGAQQT